MRKTLPILVAAGALALAPLPGALVERWYSTRLYPVIQHGLTRVSNILNVALFDAALALLFAVLLVFSVKDLRAAGPATAAARALGRVLVASAALYVVFLVVWGFNYRRQPMMDRLPFEAGRVSAESLTRLMEASVGGLNRLHAPAHAEGWAPPGKTGEPDQALASAVDAALRDLGGPTAIVAARPKRSVIDWYFRRAGVAGMTDPFFLETLVASNLLPFERPFVIAHEWSHLGGLADEGEANLAGWLACLRGTPATQYSGWLFMYGEALAALPPRDRASAASRLLPGPREDLQAIRDRLLREISPAVSAAGWRVYDSYLKANRVEAGAASYGEVVRLALGLRAAQIY